MLEAGYKKAYQIHSRSALNLIDNCEHWIYWQLLNRGPGSCLRWSSVGIFAHSWIKAGCCVERMHSGGSQASHEQLQWHFRSRLKGFLPFRRVLTCHLRPFWCRLGVFCTLAESWLVSFLRSAGQVKRFPLWLRVWRSESQSLLSVSCIDEFAHSLISNTRNPCLQGLLKCQRKTKAMSRL